MDSHTYFQLVRLSDGLVYDFDYCERSKGVFGYKRRDQDLWIMYYGGSKETAPSSGVSSSCETGGTNMDKLLGWVAYDDASDDAPVDASDTVSGNVSDVVSGNIRGKILGRPWDVLPHHQSANYPPEGIWVSRKGNKSYVYELRYIHKNNLT